MNDKAVPKCKTEKNMRSIQPELRRKSALRTLHVKIYMYLREPVTNDDKLYIHSLMKFLKLATCHRAGAAELLK